MKPTRAWTPYLLIAPAVLVFAFVVLIPAAANTVLSFADWSGSDTLTFVGFDNFARAFRDEIYLISYGNTFAYIGLTLILEVAVGLLLAGLVTGYLTMRQVDQLINPAHQVERKALGLSDTTRSLTAGIITGSVVMEQIFSIPGLGRFFVQGALNRDYTLVLGVVIFYGALIIAFNFLVDLLYSVLDPKVRAQ